jgi:hypothetical protein
MSPIHSGAFESSPAIGEKPPSLVTEPKKRFAITPKVRVSMRK